MSYVLTFLGFAALIILHEAGHFAAAKAVGMRVERFSLFFGPAILSRTRGETEYRLGVIPFGGYVKISGMSPYEELEPDVAHRAYLKQPVWKRITVISAGPLVNLVIFLVLVFGILLHEGNQTNQFSVDSLIKQTGAAQQLRLGDRVLSVDGIAAYAPNQTQAEFARRATAISKAVARHRCAGSVRNGCVATTAATVVIARGTNSPALSDVRGGAKAAAPGEYTVHIRPTYSAGDKKMLLGLSWGVRSSSISAGTAAGQSFTSGWRITKATVSTIGKLFTSSKARKQTSSVVGGYETTREELNTNGLSAGLEILAVVSLSLAIINLFPFLPLDGGHIAWAVAEKIRGRAIPFSIIERASAVGFVLIIFVFLIGLTNDIGRIRGAGFGVH